MSSGVQLQRFAECKRGERATSRMPHRVHKFMISLLQAANWMSILRVRLTYVYGKTQEPTHLIRLIWSDSRVSISALGTPKLSCKVEASQTMQK